MPSFSAPDEEPDRSAGRTAQFADQPDWPNDRTMPIRRPSRRRWSDRKLLVLACVSGLVLILIPPLLFTVLRPFGSSSPGGAAPGAAPSGGPAETSISPAQLSEAQPAAPANRDSSERLVVLARGWRDEVQRTFQREPGSQPVTWHPAGGLPERKIAGRPVLGKGSDGEMSGFAISKEGGLLFAHGISSTAPYPPEWRELPGRRLQGTPAAVQDKDGKFAVFARDVDGALWETHSSRPAVRTGASRSGWIRHPCRAIRWSPGTSTTTCGCSRSARAVWIFIQITQSI